MPRYVSLQCRQHVKWKIHFIRDYTQTWGSFPCGKTQHVRRMRSSIVNAINSAVFEYRSARFFEWYYILVLTRDSSYISGEVSSPFFSAKNATVTSYLLESPLGRFKKFRLLSCNNCVFATVQMENGNTSLLLCGLFISSSMKRAKSSYSPETSPLWLPVKLLNM